MYSDIAVVSRFAPGYRSAGVPVWPVEIHAFSRHLTEVAASLVAASDFTNTSSGSNMYYDRKACILF